MPVVCMDQYVEEWLKTLGLDDISEESVELVKEQARQQCLCDKCQEEKDNG